MPRNENAIVFSVSCLFLAGFTFLGVAFLCRLYLSGSCASLQALPFRVFCFFFVGLPFWELCFFFAGFTILGGVPLCWLYL